MKKLLILLTTFLISLSSQATLITIELDQDSYQGGDTLNANFIVSEIEENAGIQSILASFEFVVTWDNAMIEYVSSSFGTNLDVDLSSPSDQVVDDQSGNAHVSEISFAWLEDLNFAQDGLDSFLLASIEFNVTGSSTGFGTLGLSNILFGDASFLGDGFQTVTGNDKQYLVTPGSPVGVPEPSSIFLALMGLALFVRQRKMN